MRSRRFLLVAGAVAALAGAFAWYGRSRSPAPWHAKQVVLITIDTLRFDRLGVYGYQRRPTSPHLDAWAQNAVVFDRATAPAPWTVPSLGALLTGRYPAEVGSYTNSDGVHPDFTGLASMFKDEGYATASFNTHALLIRARGGFRRGFDTVYPPEWHPIVEGEHKMPFSETEPHLMHWLEKHAGSPFFVWIHDTDPHLPPTTGNPYLENEDWSRYDAEVRWMDEAIGRILARLRALGLGDDLLIVFTADHGEAFGEHGLKGHQDVMYEEVLRVPLIVQYPAMGPPRRIAAPVELIDMFATIADLAGLPLPAGSRSESLVPLLNATRAERLKPYAFHARYFFEDGRHWLAVRDNQWKLLARTPDLDPLRDTRGVPRWNLDDPKTYFELYRVDNDPGEEHDLFEQHPEQVARLQQLLADWGDSVAQGPTRTELDDATREAMRALGYDP
jgi:arylsulfatase A-like enzyme